MKRAKSIRPNRRQRGFTMIELMITVTMVAILASIAAPSMRTYVLNSRITSTAQELARSIQTARSEAMKRQTNVVVCTSANPNGAIPVCTHTADAKGWIVFVDSSSPADWRRTNTSEELLEVHAFDSSKVAVIADSSQRISYAASGFSNPNGATATYQTRSNSFVVCDSRGNVDSAGGTSQTNSVARAIDVANTGRIRMTSKLSEITTKLTGTNGACP